MSQDFPPDPDLNLPFEIYYEVVRILRATLPPPVPDTPEACACRDRAAVAQVAALVPANAEEANLGAHYVAAGAQAMDCLREIRAHTGDFAKVRQLTAQSVSMMREARGYRSLLLRVQAARAKREATEASCDSAAWTEHCARSLMTEALHTPPGAPVPQVPPPAKPPPADDQAPPDPAASATPESEEPQVDFTAEAETYAVIYPRRAQLIRRLGGLPVDCDFGPPEPELVHAIVTGASPALRALDSPSGNV